MKYIQKIVRSDAVFQDAGFAQILLIRSEIFAQQIFFQFEDFPIVIYFKTLISFLLEPTRYVIPLQNDKLENGMIRRAGAGPYKFTLGFLVFLSITLLLHYGNSRVDSELLAANQHSDEWVKLANIRSPSESHIPASDEQRAMETLVASGMAGPGGRALEKKPLDTNEHYEAMRTLVNAGLITSKDISVADLGKPSHLVEDSPVEEARESQHTASPCDLQPDHLDCSEYPSGLFSPEYARAKLGPHIKVIFSGEFLNPVAKHRRVH